MCGFYYLYTFLRLSCNAAGLTDESLSAVLFLLLLLLLFFITLILVMCLFFSHVNHLVHSLCERKAGYKSAKKKAYVVEGKGQIILLGLNAMENIMQLS